jgi:hypothetical protein
MSQAWRTETVAGHTVLLVAAPPRKGSLPRIFEDAVTKHGVQIAGSPEEVEDPELGPALRYPAILVQYPPPGVSS